MEQRNNIETFITGLNKQFGTVVILGAGSCPEYSSLVKAGFERLVLVEPHTELAAKLARRFGNVNKVAVVEKAICGKSENDTLNLNKLQPDIFSTTADCQKLLSYYPGILFDVKQQVAALPFSTLMGEINLHPEKTNLLIVDIQGAERELLKHSFDLLLSFEVILLRTGDGRLSEKKSGADIASGMLNGKEIPFFTISEFMSPYCIYVINGAKQFSELNASCRAMAKSNFNLQREVSEISKQRDLAVDKLSIANLEQEKLKKKLNESEVLREGVEEKLKLVRSQLEASNKQAHSLLQDNKELDGKHLDTKRAIEEFVVQIANSKKKLDEANEENNKLNVVLKTQNEKLEGKHLQLEETIEKLSKAEKELEKQEQQNASLQNRQLLLNEELVKAETQIDFIKDVVFRDKAF